MPPLCQQCQDATIQALEAMGGRATHTEIRRWVIEHGDIDHGAPRGHVEHHLRWSLAWLRKQGEVVPARYGLWVRRASTSAAGSAPSRTIDQPPSRS